MRLGQSVGVVTWICVSPRNTYLVPLRRGSAAPGPVPGLMECRGEQDGSREKPIPFLLRSVGFGNVLAVSAAESATSRRKDVRHTQPSGMVRKWHGTIAGAGSASRYAKGGPLAGAALRLCACRQACAYRLRAGRLSI